jgi:hypothetical protein
MSEHAVPSYFAGRLAMAELVPTAAFADDYGDFGRHRFVGS